MKISTTKEQLLYGISLAEKVTGKKESLPVLSSILLEAKNGHLILRSTNLEAGIEIIIPASIENDGVVAVAASVISQTVRSVNSDIITLQDNEGNLLLKSKGSQNIIKAIPHEEFPSFIGKSTTRGFMISREHFLNALQSVLYAASPSMIRPELGSVSVVIEEGDIIAVATDSFRLAEKKNTHATKNKSGELLIPLKHANELVYVLERISADEVEIGVEDVQCVVSGGGVRFVSRLIEGQFPNYKEIIPRSFTTKATILKTDFVEVLRKARIFSGNDQHIGFHIYPKRKIFSAIARSAEIGEMSDIIDAAVSGEDLDINFHIGYLADCLSSIRSDSLTLDFAGTGKPLVIHGASDQAFMYLVMPLNR